jgi:hypothetical protein
MQVRKEDSRLAKGKEGHKTGPENTNDVSNSDGDDSAVLELGRNDTGNDEGDDLEGSSSTVQEGRVQGAEAHGLGERKERRGKQRKASVRSVRAEVRGKDLTADLDYRSREVG